MLGFADYVIIMLVVFGMAAACRYIWRSWKNGSCPSCGGCGKKHTGKKEKGRDICLACCDGSKKNSCSGCSHCR